MVFYIFLIFSKVNIEKKKQLSKYNFQKCKNLKGIQICKTNVSFAKKCSTYISKDFKIPILHILKNKKLVKLKVHLGKIFSTNQLILYTRIVLK